MRPILIAAAALIGSLPVVAQAQHTYRSAQGAATSELQVGVDGSSMTFAARAPEQAPSLVVQAGLLRDALRQALVDSKPQRIYFLPAANQPIVDALASALAHDRGWDARAGRPVRGHLGPYLAAFIQRTGLAAPLQAVFAMEGYKLVAATVSRVVIGRRKATGAALIPVSISEIGFDAIRR